MIVMNYEQALFNITPLFPWKNPLNQQALSALCIYDGFTRHISVDENIHITK